MVARVLKITLPLLVIALLVLGGYHYWQHEQRYPNTDDAYIQAYVINIAPRIEGKVNGVFVHNHEHIKKGQLLFTIDPELYQIAVNKAQADLDNTQQMIDANEMAVESAQAVVTQRQAELADTQEQTKRTLLLVKDNYMSHADGDLATKNLRVAKATLQAAKSQLSKAIQQRGVMGSNNAQLRAAQATLAQAKLNLQYAKVTAPASGYIANFDLRVGAVVPAYQSLFALIEDQSWWAEANFKETKLDNLKPGQRAIIKVDMYPGKKFTGIVSSIADGSGSSFSLLPPENASGNWVKVTQRFPVKVLITSPQQNYPLRLGASCEVTIDTQSKVQQ